MTSIIDKKYVVCFNSRWLGGCLVTSIIDKRYVVCLTVAG